MSIEETALAVEALAEVPEQVAALARGREKLLQLTAAEAWRMPSPIGLYFARLWYFERLYPLIFATSAVGRLTAASQQR